MNHDARARESPSAPVSRRAATVAMLVLEYAGLATGFARAILIVPFCLRYIDIRVYGAWLATGDVLAWLTIAGGGEVIRQQVATRFGREDRREIGAVVGSSAAVALGYAALVGLVALLLAPHLGHWLGLRGEAAASLGRALAVVALATAIDLVATSLRAVPQGLQRPTGIGLALLACTVVELVLSVALLFRGWGVMALAAGALARSGLRLVAAVVLTAFHLVHRLGIRPRVRRDHLRALLPLIGWSTANNVGIVLGERVDALAISLVLGAQAVPAAILTKRAWDMLSALARAVGKSLSPAMAHLHGAGDVDRFGAVTRRALNLVLVLTCSGVATLWAMNEPFMTLWVGRQMYAGFWYNALLGVGTVAGVLVFSSCQILFSAGGVRAASVVQLSQNSVRAVVLVAGLPVFGIMAVPLSMLVGHGLGGVRTLWRQWAALLGHPAPLVYPIVARGTALLGLAALAAWACRSVIVPQSWIAFALTTATLATSFSAVCLALDRGSREELLRSVPSNVRRMMTARRALAAPSAGASRSARDGATVAEEPAP